MKKASAKTMKLLKSVHLAFVSLWVGGSFSLICLYWLTRAATADGILLRYSIMKIIDFFVIIPGAMGCLFTGAAFGLWTGWGFLKHRWIAAKWVLIAVQIAFGTFWLGRWLTEGRNESQAKTWGLVQVVVLLATIGLSALKPRLKLPGRNNRPLIQSLEGEGK